MKNAKNLNPVVHRDGVGMTRDVVASNHVLALWRTVIGKKVVMAVTGVVLIGFRLARHALLYRGDGRTMPAP